VSALKKIARLKLFVVQYRKRAHPLVTPLDCGSVCRDMSDSIPIVLPPPEDFDRLRPAATGFRKAKPRTTWKCHRSYFTPLWNHRSYMEWL